jgi:hypothetical protein
MCCFSGSEAYAPSVRLLAAILGPLVARAGRPTHYEISEDAIVLEEWPSQELESAKEGGRATVAQLSRLPQESLETKEAEPALVEVSSSAGLWHGIADVFERKANQMVSTLDGMPWNTSAHLTTTDAPDRWVAGNDSRAHLPHLLYHTWRNDMTPLPRTVGNETHLSQSTLKRTALQLAGDGVLSATAASTDEMIAPEQNEKSEGKTTNATKPGTDATAALRDRGGETRVREIFLVGSILAFAFVRLHACLEPAERQAKSPEDLLAEVYAEAKKKQLESAALLLTAAASAASPDVRL